jgi:hypothetical protein
VRLQPGARTIPLVPRRECGLCGRSVDVLHLKLIRHLWVCQACLMRPPQEREEVPGGGRPDPQDMAAALARFESAVHFGWLAARIVGYAVLLLLAYRSAVALHLLTGVFVADVVMRILNAVLDLRERRFRLLIEVFLLGLVGHVWSSFGGELLPADPEGKALTMLGFMGAFSLRITVFVHQVMHER